MQLHSWPAMQAIQLAVQAMQSTTLLPCREFVCVCVRERERTSTSLVFSVKAKPSQSLIVQRTRPWNLVCEREKERILFFCFLSPFLFVLSALVFVLFCFLLSCIYIATSCKCHASAMQAMQCRGHGCKPGHPFQRERVCVCVECEREKERILFGFLSPFCLFFLLWCLSCFVFFFLGIYIATSCKCHASHAVQGPWVQARPSLPEREFFLFLICFLFVISALSESTAMQPN